MKTNIVLLCLAVTLTTLCGCKQSKTNPELGLVFINATSFFSDVDPRKEKLFLVERKKPSHGFNIALVALNSPDGVRAACFIDPNCKAKPGDEVKVLTGVIVGIGGKMPFLPIVTDHPAPIELPSAR